MRYFIFALFSGLTAAVASAAPAHVHEQATLLVSVEGEEVSISLTSPLNNFLNFERAPRNDAERQRVRSMAVRLREAGSLFKPDAAAQCAQLSVALHSAALPAELLGNGVPTSAASPDRDDHADLDADYVFGCKQISALRGIDLALFSAFPNLKRLTVTVATRTSQSVQRLTPKSSRIVLLP